MITAWDVPLTPAATALPSTSELRSAAWPSALQDAQVTLRDDIDAVKDGDEQHTLGQPSGAMNVR
jgi:hypothetical protein